MPLRSFRTAAPLTPAHEAGPARLEGLWQRAQTAAAALPPFAVRADRLSRSVGRGVHGRRRAGAGDSFWQFRPYQAGDPASEIDWRRSARSDALYVRQHEWETAQNIWLWADRSASMDYRSPAAQDSKADRALLLALAAARLVVDGGERVGLYGVHARAAGGPFGLERLLGALAEAPDLQRGAFPPPQTLPRHSHLILIGDFLGEEEEIEARMRDLLSIGVSGHLLQVIDPYEEDFPFRGRVAFEGMEAEAAIVLDRTEDLADAYRRRMAAWRGRLGEMARRVGWTHSVHRSDHGPALALIALMGLIGQGA